MITSRQIVVTVALGILITTGFGVCTKKYKTDYDYYEVELEASNARLFFSNSKMQYDQGFLNIATYDGLGTMRLIKMNPRFPIVIDARIEFLATIANVKQPEYVTFKARRGGAGAWQLEKTLLVTPDSPYVILQGSILPCGTLSQ